MFDASRHDPLGRFTRVADLYARCRPDYPAEALDFIAERCGLTIGSCVVDVGSGTGISSRLLAQRGFRLIGLEPNADMRRYAENANSAEFQFPPVYQSATGEATRF